MRQYAYKPRDESRGRGIMWADKIIDLGAGEIFSPDDTGPQEKKRFSMSEQELNELQRYIIKTHAQWIKEIKEELSNMQHHISKNRMEVEGVKIELAKLGVKSGVWGALGSAIPVLITIFVLFITKVL